MEYFIYAHLKSDEVRYVGCGNVQRPYDFVRRNDRWRKIFSSKNKPTVVIIAEAESESEALKIESEYIQFYKKRGNRLANKEPARYWLGKKREQSVIDAMQAKAHTPEAIAKRKAKMTGRKMSDEHKATRKSSAPKKAVYCIQNDIVYESANEAARVLGFKSIGKITEICQGKRKTHKGLSFKYAESL